MDLVEKLLYDLHSLIQTDQHTQSSSLITNNTDIITNIEAIVFSGLDYAELQYIIVLLFKNEQNPPSLLQFLIKTSRHTDHDIILIKKQALKFIAIFVKIMHKLILSHTSFIFHTLIQLFKVETSMEVKTCLLLPIKNILRKQSIENNSTTSSTIATSSTTVAIHADMKFNFVNQKQLASIYDILINILNDTTKKNKGLKVEGLKVLGLLIYEYPFETASSQYIKAILKHCKYYLDANFTAQKDIDLSIIAGCFSCLDRCFWHYEEYYQPHSYQELWRYLLQALETINFSDTKRYAAIGKALRLLSHHSGLFQSFLTTDALRSYQLLYNAMICEKTAAEKHASNALYSVLHQISNTLVTSSINDTAVSSSHVYKTVMKLYKEFMVILKEGSSTDSLMRAVHGLSALAPAIIVITIHRQVDNKTATDSNIPSISTTTTATTQCDTKISITTLILNIIEAARYYINDTQQKHIDSNMKLASISSMTMYNKMLFLTAVCSFISASITTTNYNTISHLNHTASDKVTISPSLLIFTPKIVQFLEEYIVEAVVGYSMFWTKQQVLAERVLCKLGHALITMQYIEETSSNLTVIDSTLTDSTLDNSIPTREVVVMYLNSITSSLLLRAVSRRMVIDEKAKEPLNPQTMQISEYSEEPEDRLLFSYLPLLNELLLPKDKETKALLIQHWQPDYYENISDVIYNKLLTKITQMLDTLDLKYKYCTVDYNSEESSAIVPDNMADQDVFLSLVTFLEHFMIPLINNSALELVRFRVEFEQHWAFAFVLKLITLSELYPMISGIIRLLTLSLRVAGDYINNYISNISTMTSSDDLMEDSNKKICLTLKLFVLALQQRIITSTGNFHCELLDAILCLLNVIPHKVLSLIELIPALQLSLRTGYQLLSSIESLTEQLSFNKNDLLPHLPQLLPLLDKYLQSNSINDFMNSKEKLYLKSSAATNKLIRETASNVSTINNNEDKTTNQSMIQNSILTFLGRLGGLNQHLLTPPHLTVQRSLAWSDKESLLINLPFETTTIAGDHSLSLDICLDIVLQRLIELLSSNINKLDPQLSSAASELLHALVIYMIGKAASFSHVKQPLFSPIYHKVFPVVIHLSVGSLACNILFEKLLFQLIRWISGMNQVHEDDVSAMLDSLFDCLGNSEVEGTEREVCSRGVVEFFAWGIKQSTKKDLEVKTNSSVDSLLQRICMMICHPNQAKRGSSVTIIIKLYRYLRDETSLIRRYALKILHFLLKSIQMYPNSPFEQDIITAVSKFEEIIFIHVTTQFDLAQLLISSDMNKRDYPQDLSVFIRELLNSSLQSEYLIHRRQCMRIFTTFCPLLQDQNIKRHSEFIVQYLNDQASLALQNAFKHQIVSTNQLQQQEAMKLMMINLIENVYNFWIIDNVTISNQTSATTLGSFESETSLNNLQRLSCCLDGYNWLVKMKYLSLGTIFRKSTEQKQQQQPPKKKIESQESNSSTTGRKRKKDEISSLSVEKIEEIPSNSNPTENIKTSFMTESVLLNCIARFINCYYHHTKQQGNETVAYREVLYRVLIFMCNLLEDSNHSDFDFIITSVIANIWNHIYFHQLVIRELSTSHDVSINKFDLVYAIRRLYMSVISIPNYSDTLNLVHTRSLLNNELDRYISLIQQIWPVSATQNITLITQNLLNYGEFYRLLRDTRILPVIFEEHEVIRYQNLAKWLLYQFNSMFTSQSINSSVIQSNEQSIRFDVSSKSNKQHLVVREFGSAVIDLSITLDLQLVSSSNSSNMSVVYPELLESLSGSDSGPGSFLLEHYGDLLITYLLAPISQSACDHITLLKKENLNIFLEYTFVFIPGTGSKRVLIQLFDRILSALLIRLNVEGTKDVILLQYTDEILLPACTKLFQKLPDESIMMLLELCSIQRRLDNTLSSFIKDKDLFDLEKLVYDSCIISFIEKKPRFIALATSTNTVGVDSEMNVITDAIVIRLKWLSYIIPSIIQAAYLPIGSITSPWAILNYKKLLPALEELVALRFPLDSKKLQLSSENGRGYSKLFYCYLATLKQCGSISMLSALLPSLREGESHVYYDAIKSTLISIATEVDMEVNRQSLSFQSYAAIHELVKFCFEQIFDIYQDLPVKNILLTYLLIPILQSSTSTIFVEIFSNTIYFKDPQSKGGEGIGGITVLKYIYDLLIRDLHTVNMKEGLDAAESLAYIQSYGYRILEILYDRCDLSILKSSITLIFTNDMTKTTGKELYLALIKIAYNQLRLGPEKNITYQQIPSNTLSKLYSAAFCCLAMVIAKTQEVEGNFDKFIFQETPSQDVWKRILSCSLFDDVNGILLNGNIYNIQSGNFTMAVLGGAVNNNTDRYAKSLRARQKQRERQLRVGSTYASSQTTVGSGMSSYLSQYISGTIIENSSVTKSRNSNNNVAPSYSLYSLVDSSNSNNTNSRQNHHQDEYEQSQSYSQSQQETYRRVGIDMPQPQSMSTSNNFIEIVPGLDDQVIYLEMNDINKHPAMGICIRVIQRISKLRESQNIVPDKTQLPTWLQECRTKLDVGNSNVRLFILRLLMNKPISDIILPWIQSILPTILKCAIHELCDIPRAQTAITTLRSMNRPTIILGYNYVLKDLVFVLCYDWKDCKPDEHCQQEASQLLSFLLKHVWCDEDYQITKDNVNSIKLLASLWFDSIRNNNFPLEISPILELIITAAQPTGGAYATATSAGSQSVQKRQTGLTLLKLFFTYSYPLLEERYSETCCTSQILDAVIDCMAFPRKEVIEQASEMAGIILNKINEYQNDNKGHLLISECQLFKKKVEVAIEQKIYIKNGIDLIATCLRTVSLNYPAFLTREMLMKTIHYINVLKPRSKYEYLDMLCCSTSNLSTDISSTAPIKILNELEPYLLIFLVDLFTIAFGRGRKLMRLPVIQINTILLLRKHVADLIMNVDLLEKIIGSSKSEGLNFCLSDQSAVQVRDVTYKLLIDVWNSLSSSFSASYNINQPNNLRRYDNLKRKICQLLINGLRDRDTVGMNENSLVSDSISGNFTISSYKYDVVKYWTDLNSERIGIRRQIFDFFEANHDLSGGYGLSSDPFTRLKTLMTDLFDASQLSSSSQWLQYSSFLLLSLSRKNQIYTNMLFQRSLSDSTSYHDLDVTALSSSSTHSTDRRLSAMTPLFFLDKTLNLITKLNTQKNSLGSFLTESNLLTSQNFRPTATQSIDELSNRDGGYLRGTQQVAWTQLDTEAKMIGVDTSSTQYEPVPIHRQNITTQMTPIRFRSTTSKPSWSSSGSSNITQNMNDLSGSIEQTQGPNQTAQSTVVSRAAQFASLSAIQSSVALERKKVQKKKVVMYRKYREGELPDINISLCDILQPLQSLCLLDDNTAGLLFSLVYTGFFQKAFNQDTDASFSRIYSMSHDLQQMLQFIRTNSSTSILVSTLLRCNTSSMKFTMKKLSLPLLQTSKSSNISSITNKLSSIPLIPADLIVECAIQSNNFHSGIESLEQQLILLELSDSKKRDFLSSNVNITSNNLKRKNREEIIFSSSNKSNSTNDDNLEEEIPTQVIDEDMMTVDELIESRLNQTNHTVPSIRTTAVTGTQKEKPNPTTIGYNREDIWRQLYRLYDQLNQTDILLGLTARLVSNNHFNTEDCRTTISNTNQTVQSSVRLALDAEMDGNYIEAIRIYSALNQHTDDFIIPNVGNTTKEKDMWDERTLLCMNKLCDWQQLHDGVDKITRSRLMEDGIAKRSSIQYTSLPRLLSELDVTKGLENKIKEQLIPKYLNSLLHLSCPYKGFNHRTTSAIKELKEFIDLLTLNHSSDNLDSSGLDSQTELKHWLERNYPMELAIVYAVFEQWTKARLYCDQAHRLFINQWSTIHPCAYQARIKLLMQLQPILEIRDACEYYSMNSGTGNREHQSKFLFKWENSSPFLIDEVNQWATISQCRTIGLHRLLNPEPSSGNQTTEEHTMATKAKRQLSNIHIKTAAAAVYQKTLGVVKSELDISNYLLKSVPDIDKVVGSLMEVNVVYHYNSQIISQHRDHSYQNKCVPILESILGLLDRKLLETSPTTSISGQYGTGLQDGTLSNGMNILQLKILRADWLLKWSECEYQYNRNHASNIDITHNRPSDTADEITIATLEAYDDCSHTIDDFISKNQKSRINSVSNMFHNLRIKLSTNFTMHCDNLFQKISNGGETDLIEKFKNSSCIQNTTYSSLRDENAVDIAAALVVNCYVKGLKLGNNYCIQRVLRLVQLIGCHKSTENILLDALPNIPSWVFLPYAASMMGCFDRPEGAVIASVLEHTAKEYSTAMYYSYHITSEFLREVGKHRSAKLEKLLRTASPHQEAFIESLTCLTHPEQRWNDGIKELYAIVNKAESDLLATASTSIETTNRRNNRDYDINSFDKQTIVDAYRRIQSITLNLNWKFVGAKIGTHNIRWAKTAKPLADAIVGINGDKLLNCKRFSDMKKLLERLKEVSINAGAGHGAFNLDRGYVSLNQFSEWLPEFDPLLYHIEVPGQYTSGLHSSDGPPNLKEHEKIVSFDSSLLVMPSVRKPKRIKLLGSAGTLFTFLVKGGEDLRNDERIQQLFKLMNHVIQSKLEHSDMILDEESEATTSTLRRAGVAGTNQIYSRLSARTYVVVPMSSQVGILEWVNNTAPLETILKEEIQKDTLFCSLNKNAINNKNEVILDRLHAFDYKLKALKDQYNAMDYHQMYKKTQRNEAIDVYQQRLNALPNDFLRRRFLSMAVNAETFLTIRSEFAYKLAVNNLYGYILGIGDRHLGNILIDKLTGGVILIDFGVCFDIGSSVLPVPELIPFRLTTELRSVLQPLDATGVFRHYMSLCMKILREDASTPGGVGVYNSETSQQQGSSRGVIPNALEVYVNDPVLDWVKGTTSKLKSVEKNSSNSDTIVTTTVNSATTATNGTDVSYSARDESDSLRESLEWEPRRRVHTCVQKLLGVDPIYLLYNELSRNPHVIKQKSLQALGQIINSSSISSATSTQHEMKGVAADDATNSTDITDYVVTGEKVISVTEQVDKLIDLATDSNILVRQWTGLMTCL